MVGAGAIGGLLGAWLSRSGVETTALARGATLESLQRSGWRVRETDGSLTTAPVTAAASAAELGVHDVVVVAVKAQSLAALAPRLAPLVGPGTVVLPAMNGVPWWFTTGLGGPADGLRLRSVDPDGAIAVALPPAQVVGCVVHLGASTAEPGLVVHGSGRRLIVGEPAGSATPRLHEVAGLLGDAGFEVEQTDDVRQAAWYKLWGNMTVNPISALTGASMGPMLADDLVTGLIEAVMLEAREVGARIGCPIDETPAARVDVTRRLGDLEPSMLQDARAGRQLELDALTGAARELAQAVGVATPHTDALLGLTRLAARTRGLYPA
ncbi:2-dehydropantoate 2-reductase [Angustibacter aerolatus]